MPIASRLRRQLTWTMVRSPLQRHHMLVRHVPVRVAKVALYQIIVSPVLLLQTLLVRRGRADEEEESHVGRLLAPGLPDHVPLRVVLRRRMHEHQEQRVRPVAGLMVDREPEVLDVDQRGFVTERKIVQRKGVRGGGRVAGQYEQVTGGGGAAGVRRQGAGTVDVQPEREASSQCQGYHEDQGAWRRTGGMKPPLIQHANEPLSSYAFQPGWEQNRAGLKPLEALSTSKIMAPFSYTRCSV